MKKVCPICGTDKYNRDWVGLGTMISCSKCGLRMTFWSQVLGLKDLLNDERDALAKVIKEDPPIEYDYFNLETGEPAPAIDVQMHFRKRIDAWRSWARKRLKTLNSGKKEVKQ